jgi:hypothetical protein
VPCSRQVSKSTPASPSPSDAADAAQAVAGHRRPRLRERAPAVRVGGRTPPAVARPDRHLARRLRWVRVRRLSPADEASPQPGELGDGRVVPQAVGGVARPVAGGGGRAHARALTRTASRRAWRHACSASRSRVQTGGPGRSRDRALTSRPSSPAAAPCQGPAAFSSPSGISRAFRAPSWHCEGAHRRRRRDHPARRARPGRLFETSVRPHGYGSGKSRGFGPSAGCPTSLGGTQLPLQAA